MRSRRSSSEFGGLDVLVNNAGVVRYGYLPKFEDEDWDYVFDINLKAMYRTARVAIPEMRKRGGGAIVNLASVQAYWSHQGAVAYSASKGSPTVPVEQVVRLGHQRWDIENYGLQRAGQRMANIFTICSTHKPASSSASCS